MDTDLPGLPFCPVRSCTFWCLDDVLGPLTALVGSFLSSTLGDSVCEQNVTGSEPLSCLRSRIGGADHYNIQATILDPWTSRSCACLEVA